ncbi:hypothetical protein [Streptomyces griseus]|uniref:hypothetical protein n=1 Tax=Streptomyces griseus TaxID=1911 RepID=UPI0036822C50
MTATDARTPAPAVLSQPVPRWAELAARAVPWCVLPSGLWRVAVIIGMALGLLEGGTSIAEETYMLALTVVSELLALLTLGLVRPWGEILPRRFPLVGGRRVPVAAAVVPAALGAFAVTAAARTLREPRPVGRPGRGGSRLLVRDHFWLLCSLHAGSKAEELQRWVAR